MWIFSSPKNYSEMVEKISKCSFAISALLMYFLSYCNYDFAQFLRKISFGVEYEFIGIKLSLAGIGLPLLIGIAEHIFKIHDKISSFLHIRKRYDKNIIIFGLLESFSIGNRLKDLNDDDISKLMSCCFYKYASSTKPEIDEHSIHLALNEWCWYWIALDTEILLLITGIVFFFSNISYENFSFVFVTISIMFVIMRLIYKQCVVYTKAEVREIIKDSGRKEEIRKAIQDALSLG